MADSFPSPGTPLHAERTADMPTPWDLLLKFLRPLASLKLTVVLFALSIVLVLAGTLAQVDKDIWQVIHEYFRCFVTWIPFQIFFPPSFFPSQPKVPGGIPFPGGWTLGAALGINLLAAHLVRFTVRARGTQVLWGSLLMLVGILSTWLVIRSGSSESGVLDDAWISWNTLWLSLEIALAGAFLACIYGVVLMGSARRAERYLLAAVAVILGALLGFFLYQGTGWRPDDAGMRILWQLVKGTFAGLVLLAGCWPLFGKRAGIVLLHGGIGLMMFNELFVGLTNVEAQMQIEEGETVNFVQDIRTLELAIIDRSDPKVDTVTVIPLPRIQAVAGQEQSIQDERLPFDIQVVKYLQNARVRRATEQDENPATAGQGTQWVADELRPGAGTDNDSKVDLSAAYVKLLKKGTDESLGVRLVSIVFAAENQPERVQVGDKEYDLFLRFERTYKPYSMTLKDVRKVDYVGTNTPRDYSSDVRLVDPTRNVDRELKIWMNNPLRFAGETFYQSSYNQYPKTVVDPETGRPERKMVEATTLSVVSNTGWMIPYVGCMIVAVGMLAQFTITLLRFLKRQDAADSLSLQPLVNDPEPDRASAAVANQRPQPAKNARRREERPGRDETAAPLEPELAGQSGGGMASLVFPLLIVLIFAGWVLSKARPPKPSSGEFDLYAFGELPLVEQGRVKPFDTLARNSLKIISGRQDFKDAEGKTQPAIRWLLDVMADPDTAEKHRVFRIENTDVLQILGLEPRQGLRYAVEEFREKAEVFNEQVERARKVEAIDRDILQRKLIELDGRIRTYTLLQASFRPPPLPDIPTAEEFRNDPLATQQKMEELRQAVFRMTRQLTEMRAPLAVPVSSESEENPEAKTSSETWQPYAIAWTRGFLATQMLGEKVDPATGALNAILVNYAKGKKADFNEAVEDYANFLERARLADVSMSKVRFESFFNHFQPFYHAAVLCVVAFVLAAAAWLGWSVPLNRASFWLLTVTLVLHTFGLWARMKISGRPPVTNLYSSAVFIGWGAIILGLILERIFKLGIGNIIASVSGFATLLIAHMLSGEGDTFTVLQAVLDTQFWLATHVTCITFGYATTYVAGLLGVLYIVLGACTPKLTKDLGRQLTRMTYGIVCFAIFFSFVGTVLGGLWADDSWGRFWGWDPKENGALIIVLWNALLLHARWGQMVKERGIAALAVGGNIVTSWSWFGVNELGVGLHSYGFTEGVLAALGLFALSQLAVIGLCFLPKNSWWSERTHHAA